MGCLRIGEAYGITGREFHTYLQPQRAVDWRAQMVHGISDDMLRGQPLFRDKAQELIDFIDGCEVVIHNASFDVRFLDHELALWKGRAFRQFCQVTCSLKLARQRYPGLPNKLDDLIQRLRVPMQRNLHGALLDAQLLAQVVLRMRAASPA